MTVEAMSGLPFQAGSAVAAAAGRTALWAVSAYMQAPLRNTAIAALVGLSAMAGSNALYRQSHHHPAPLFGSFQAAPSAAAKKATPVMPAERPAKLTQKVSPETTGSVEAQPITPRALGNDDVTAVQQQLKTLAMFDGTVDGIYGPKTARAVKAFEQRLGRTATGKLTPDLVALIKTAPLPAPPAATLAIDAVAPTEVASTEVAPVAPLALAEENPLPAPAPLTAANATSVATVAEPQQVTQVAELDAPADTTALPAVTADDASPASNVTTRTVQPIAIHAAAAPAAADEQAMPAALTPQTDTPPPTVGADAALDTKIVAAVQRGLNSLGFLHGQINGIADEATSKAIRNFEVYYNYNVTGRITSGLVNLLVQNGAVI